MSVRKRQIFTAMQVVVNAATKVYAANSVNKVWETTVRKEDAGDSFFMRAKIK